MPIAQVGDLNVVYDITGTGEPVLLVNGIGAARAGWGLQLPAVAKEFQAITFDNRDVGETGPGTDEGLPSIRRFADDAVGLLNALGIQRAHVAGASMGGCIAQEIAISHPERTKSVTIICSWAEVDPWMAELWEQWEHLFAAQGAVEWARTTWLWVFTHRHYLNPDNLKDLVAGAAADPRPQTLAMYLRKSHAAKTFSALDRLPGVTAPAHVIAGAEDIFTPPRYSEAIAAAIPNARLTVLPNAGHGAFWETTDAFNGAVLGFLRRFQG